MRQFIGALLATDAQGNPSYLASLGLVVLAVMALVPSVWRHHTRAKRVVSRRPLPPYALATAGVVGIVAAFVVSCYGVLPIVRSIVWPPIRDYYSSPDWWEFETAVGPFEELLAGVVTAGVMSFVAGWLIERMRAVTAASGYWFASPVSIIVGAILWGALFPAGRTELEHWTGTVWLLRAIVASPVYARLFQVGAVFRMARGGLTRG